MFRPRFRMSQKLFLRIMNVVEGQDNYFVQRRDARGMLELSHLQKMSVVMRMLAYDVPVDVTCEYINIEESTTIESLKRFCRVIVKILGKQYLRSPKTHEINSLLRIGTDCDFPGMLGSLDCMHGKWKNCPTSWAGQYCGRSGHPTIILEIVVDYDL